MVNFIVISNFLDQIQANAYIPQIYKINKLGAPIDDINYDSYINNYVYCSLQCDKYLGPLGSPLGSGTCSFIIPHVKIVTGKTSTVLTGSTGSHCCFY